MSNSTSSYHNAIKFRKEAIEKLRTNPPKDWSPEYLELNIDLIQQQIDQLVGDKK